MRFGLLLFSFLLHFTISFGIKRTFTIDYEGNQFLKDGESFVLIGGAVHYFMIPPPYWQDRLLKTRSMGVNTIQVYVAWNLHEFKQGQFKWDGWSNITGYLDVIQSLGMLVTLRPGPFIDAEFEFGGLPWWLLKTRNIQLRTSDTRYLTAVKRWFDVLLPKLQPYLYENGGPITSVQIENEYGSYAACDRYYTAFLRDLVKSHLGKNVLLFTTDGNSQSYLRCGVVPNVYPTVDFGIVSQAEVLQSYKAQKAFAPKGPFVNSEFYPGWMDQWGKPHQSRDTKSYLATMDNIWALNGSFTIYVSSGGTLYGYSAGGESQGPDSFYTTTTSYDFDAPISEAGDPTPKYLAIRNHIEQLIGLPNPYPIPVASKKLAYGVVKMRKLGNFLDLLDQLCPHKFVHHTEYPMNVEWLDFPYGFVLYENIARGSGSVIRIPAVHDRAYLIINGVLKAILQRPVLNATINVGQVQAGDKIDILIENQGRVCYGNYINDTKGLVSNVTLDGQILVKWDIYPLDINRLFNSESILLPNHPNNDWKKPVFLPTFYLGSFSTSKKADTFLDTTGWGKGQAFLNGVNLGRYWRVGPTYTMYTPKPILADSNQLLMFELDKPGNCQSDQQICQVSFVDKHKRLDDD